jgi:hypothetical protein
MQSYPRRNPLEPLQAITLLLGFELPHALDIRPEHVHVDSLIDCVEEFQLRPERTGELCALDDRREHRRARVLHCDENSANALHDDLSKTRHPNAPPPDGGTHSAKCLLTTLMWRGLPLR